jgi:hypothetical protein
MFGEKLPIFIIKTKSKIIVLLEINRLEKFDQQLQVIWMSNRMIGKNFGIGDGEMW